MTRLPQTQQPNTNSIRKSVTFGDVKTLNADRKSLHNKQSRIVRSNSAFPAQQESLETVKFLDKSRDTIATSITCTDINPNDYDRDLSVVGIPDPAISDDFQPTVSTHSEINSIVIDKPSIDSSYGSVDWSCVNACGQYCFPFCCCYPNDKVWIVILLSILYEYAVLVACVTFFDEYQNIFTAQFARFSVFGFGAVILITSLCFMIAISPWMKKHLNEKIILLKMFVFGRFGAMMLSFIMLILILVGINENSFNFKNNESYQFDIACIGLAICNFGSYVNWFFVAREFYSQSAENIEFQQELALANRKSLFGDT